MRRLIWRKIVIPSLLLLSTVILLSIFKRCYHHQKEEFHTAPEELKTILAKAVQENKRRIERVDEICRTYNLGHYKNNGSKPAFKYPPTPQYSVYYFDLLEWDTVLGIEIYYHFLGTCKDNHYIRD